MKATEAALARKEALPTLRKTFVVVLDDGNAVNIDPHVVEGMRSLQAAADFKASFKNAGTDTKEKVADLEGQRKIDVLET